jgi:2-oxoglutarate dehydrogenase E1 component
MSNQDSISNTDPAYIEAQYQLYLADPDQVDASFRYFFSGFDFALKQYPQKPLSGNELATEFRVLNLINAYRERGHYFTKTNPVRTRRSYFPTLDIQNFGLSDTDLSKPFRAGQEIGIGDAPLSKIIEVLQQTYCRSVGVEFMYIRNVEIVKWIRDRMEGDKNTPAFTRKLKKQILESIARAVGFEKFVHRKFSGHKRFSLEGAESLIPALEAIAEKAAWNGYKECVIGMPHRGRLNVLANILGKPYADIFSEFDGAELKESYLLGDVKYHLGYSSDVLTASGKPIHLTLSPNPSHLEAVNPIVQGIVRACSDRSYDGDFTKALPLLIHGDASVAAQGVVYETLQMSELPGYKTGGAIHIVINNQLGFTTNYLDGRSSIYCTDIAKIIQSPIFHVNGDDVEAVVHVAMLAFDYRHRFGKDVFIDLLCYRKYGHNEGDEPRFTQPLLYKAIEKHPDPMRIYLEELLSQNMITNGEFEQFKNDFDDQLEKGLFISKRDHVASISNFLANRWQNFHGQSDQECSPLTAISPEMFTRLGNQIASLPAEKGFFKKIIQIQEARKTMVDEGRVDWALAELLAFGSLLHEGFPVRLSGQDSERGTFSQRHAVLKIENSEEKFIPLQHLGEGQAAFEVFNSLLSEYGVLGFEYGYALATPRGLTLWEAQFGDFCNGAQIIIDQFICCAETKWNVHNGLVLLLPHGYEGQGPEHSNARLDRFLALCAAGNIQVANCSTPSNYFHLLRRQVHCAFRKPLIVFTPKSLLRHPACISPRDAFTGGGFHKILDDEHADRRRTERLLFCSGKIYYELDQKRHELKEIATAIIRIEQLYPFPLEELQEIAGTYKAAKEWIWVQEEPVNMGAWPFIMRRMKGIPLLLVARPESGSPATGSASLHRLQQQKIIEKAFGTCDCDRRSEQCEMICAPEEWNYLHDGGTH